MSGVIAGPLVGEQPAGPAHAGLHLVEDQQQVVLVAQPPQLLEEVALGRADAALALDRLDQDGRGLARRSPPRPAARSPSGTLIEAGQTGPETFEMLLLAAGRDGRHRAAVEGALEGDDAVALGLAALDSGTGAPS